LATVTAAATTSPSVVDLVRRRESWFMGSAPTSVNAAGQMTAKLVNEQGNVVECIVDILDGGSRLALLTGNPK